MKSKNPTKRTKDLTTTGSTENKVDDVRESKAEFNKRMTGFDDSDVGLQLFGSVCNYYNQDQSKREKCADLAVSSLLELKPKDGIEGMLSAQMLVTHDMAMELLKRSRASERLDCIELSLNGATKLLRAFALQVEVLNRYRGKGQQKVTVEHVTVNAGGQAIVGNVDRQGGGRGL